jgi:hypothetical protein
MRAAKEESLSPRREDAKEKDLLGRMDGTFGTAKGFEGSRKHENTKDEESQHRMEAGTCGTIAADQPLLLTFRALVLS